ncbi:FtsX-like permease family protein [Ferruginibacter yonginensis]|uniref:FtsX-like permease family protein n=1 Tax=Ferruginibacter yonginensis TaxID=1310416 RepID=A0ABV8QUP5_9BACT
MFVTFAWRYFKAKKSANAINIIAWVTTVVIAFATCSQILVLSVFNGFEGLVKSLYSSFYNDVKIKPKQGKTFVLSANQIAQLKQQPFCAGLSMIVEEKALLQNETAQTVVTLKGVDSMYKNISGVPAHINNGSFDVGTEDAPKIIVGYGVQNAAAISFSEAFPPSNVTIILPKKTTSTDALAAMAQGNALTAGVFTIQQEIDNEFAITNIDFVKLQMGLQANEYSAAEMAFTKNTDEAAAIKKIQTIIGDQMLVLNKYEQNANLYSTMRLEKWAIYAVLTLILVIAAFNMVSALTMLVLEKQKDISILKSMGTSNAGIQKIFLSEGLLLGIIGTTSGILLALIISFLQVKFHLIKIMGGSFLIDYFPVKLIASDLLMVALTAIFISVLASWFPAQKAARQAIALK